MQRSTVKHQAELQESTVEERQEGLYEQGRSISKKLTETVDLRLWELTDSRLIAVKSAWEPNYVLYMWARVV